MRKSIVVSLLVVISAMCLFTGCGPTLYGLSNVTEDIFASYDSSNLYPEIMDSDDLYFYDLYENSDSSDVENDTQNNEQNMNISLMDRDERIAEFVPSTYTYKEVCFAWESYSSHLNWTWNVPLWEEMYQYYSNLERYYQPCDFEYYINDEWNSQICKSLAESIVNTAMEKGMSKRNAVMEVVAFVQTITYEYDLTEDGEACEYPKYPIETLMEGRGDCEDSTILLATMLKELGYSVALVHFEGHIMLGIAGDPTEIGTYFMVDGTNYYVMETTYPGWKWGQLPEDYYGESAYVYVIY